MPSDFLEQLAEVQVGQPPPEFDRKLHERVNRALTVQHLLGLAVGSLPWAAGHFLLGLLGAVVMSFSGRSGGPQPPKNEKSA